MGISEGDNSVGGEDDEDGAAGGKTGGTGRGDGEGRRRLGPDGAGGPSDGEAGGGRWAAALSLIPLSEPTRLRRSSYAVFRLKKKKKKKRKTLPCP